jgi:hypothetical protein
MEQRQAVRIPVQLRARLLHEDGRQEGRRDGHEDASTIAISSSIYPTPSGWSKGQRRSPTDHGVECGCSQEMHHGSQPHGVLSTSCGPLALALALAIDGLVDDLSRTGLFLRTPQTLPPGTSATVCLELPEEQVVLRGQVVRIECGARTGLGLRFASEQPNRLVVNYLMRCHAHSG